MKYDFNKLERIAAHLIKNKKYEEACAIYYFMSDGDPSLDGGYLGYKIGFCYECMENFQAAKYWYGRAVDENPTIEKYILAKQRFFDVNVDALIASYG